MKNKKITSIIIFFLILLISNISQAFTLNMNLVCLKEKIKVGNEFEVKITWDKPMQAADFSLQYDNEKVKFIKTDIEENFISEKENKIDVAWFSMNNENKTSIIFKFKAISDGEAEFKIRVSGGFATGALKVPDRYNIEPLKIEIKQANNIIKIVLIMLVLIIILLFIKKIKINKKKRRNK